MKSAIFLNFMLSTFVFCSVSLAQHVDDNDANWVDTEALRSHIFIKSNDEIHFVPNRHDPELKATKEFKFDSESQSHVFRRIKRVVGDRRIDICPNPDVDVKLLADVIGLFTEPKHRLNFRDLYADMHASTDSPFDELPDPEIPKKMSLLRNAFNDQCLRNATDLPAEQALKNFDLQFDKADSDELTRSLRSKFAAIFDQRQELQLRNIDAQIAKLKNLKVRIQERATRKDKEVEAMLETFLKESAESTR